MADNKSNVCQSCRPYIRDTTCFDLPDRWIPVTQIPNLDIASWVQDEKYRRCSNCKRLWYCFYIGREGYYHVQELPKSAIDTVQSSSSTADLLRLLSSKEDSAAELGREWLQNANFDYGDLIDELIGKLDTEEPVRRAARILESLATVMHRLNNVRPVPSCEISKLDHFNAWLDQWPAYRLRFPELHQRMSQNVTFLTWSFIGSTTASIKADTQATLALFTRLLTDPLFDESMREFFENTYGSLHDVSRKLSEAYLTNEIDPVLLGHLKASLENLAEKSEHHHSRVRISGVQSILHPLIEALNKRNVIPDEQFAEIADLINPPVQAPPELKLEEKRPSRKDYLLLFAMGPPLILVIGPFFAYAIDSGGAAEAMIAGGAVALAHWFFFKHKNNFKLGFAIKYLAALNLCLLLYAHVGYYNDKQEQVYDAIQSDRLSGMREEWKSLDERAAFHAYLQHTLATEYRGDGIDHLRLLALQGMYIDEKQFIYGPTLPVYHEGEDVWWNLLAMFFWMFAPGAFAALIALDTIRKD